MILEACPIRMGFFIPFFSSACDRTLASKKGL